MMRSRIPMAALALALMSTPAIAGWKVMPHAQPVAVAKGKLTVTPTSDWNRWSVRPAKWGEMWTLEGLSLDQLSFFAGVTQGKAIYRERSKKDEPLPKFHAKMLAPEIVQAVEGSYRILLRTPLFEVDEVAPVKLAGHDGVRFTFRYTLPDDEVRRRGEGRAAIIDGQLYLITYTAPAIHYFDAGIADARAIMDSARL